MFPQGRDNLKSNRILVGIAIAVVMIGAVLLRQFNPLITDMLFLFIMIMTGIEMARALGSKYDPPLLGFVIAYPFCAFAAFIGGLYLSEVSPFFNGLVCVLLLDAAYLGILSLVTLTTEKYGKNVLFSTMFCVVYPMTIGTFFFALNRLGNPAGLFDATLYGATPIALLFAISALSDTMALVFGVLFKGPKLCPKISPNKTIAGAVGGLVGGVIGAAIIMGLTQIGAVNIYLGLEKLAFANTAGLFVLHAFLMGILGSIATQAGDLTASYVKRIVGIKDYGKSLGDHGGFMDRVDGQLFNAFLLYVYLMIAALV